jgi:hypothetical protein
MTYGQTALGGYSCQSVLQSPPKFSEAPFGVILYKSFTGFVGWHVKSAPDVLAPIAEGAQKGGRETERQRGHFSSVDRPSDSGLDSAIPRERRKMRCFVNSCDLSHF